MQAYSADVRQRVITQWHAGKSQAELASICAVSPGSIKRWVRHYKMTGTFPPQGRQHWHRTIGPAQHEALHAHVVRLDEGARTAFRHLLATLDVRHIAVVDERGTHIGMTPQRGRAPRGQRAFAKTLRNYGEHVSLIAALNVAGMGAGP